MEEKDYLEKQDIAYPMLCRYWIRQIYEKQNSLAYSSASLSVFQMIVKAVVEKIWNSSCWLVPEVEQNIKLLS